MELELMSQKLHKFRRKKIKKLDIIFLTKDNAC